MTKTTTPHFGLLCLASYLLSLSYGSTFLLSLLVTSRGGNEQDAGSIIAIAMLSTVVAVLGSGHLADWLGTARAIAQSALCLIGACLGFALVPGVDFSLWLCGLLLGLGWGAFYTLGPILVVALVEPARRTHCFALLSGSMMSGIGSGPLAGKLASLLHLPLETAFYTAALAAAVGMLVFAWLDRQHPAQAWRPHQPPRRHPGAALVGALADPDGGPGRRGVRRAGQLSDHLRGQSRAGLFAVLRRLHARRHRLPAADRRLGGAA